MLLPTAAGFSNSLFMYARGLMFDPYCVPCRMSIPHLQCQPIISPESPIKKDTKKKMSDKLQETPNPPPPWGFQTGFRTGVTEHPFNYEEQNRSMESSQQEFDNDVSRQPAPPFMQHFLPRIGLPFADFTDYHRFNGFQRNAFLTAPFGAHIPNTSFAHTFPLNATVPGPMPIMDGFSFHHPHTLMPHSLPPVTCPIKSKPDDNPDDIPDKPPILSAEYPVKQETVIKFDSVVPKEEPMDEATARDILDKKKNPNSFHISHQLGMNKEYESNRPRDDIIPFNHQFYPAPIDMGTGATFKEEMSTPPILDAHIPPEYDKFHTGKRPDFQQPPLHDCQVCLSTHANGLHFGARTCAACAAFFRRTISDDKRYVCKRNQRCTNASRDGTGYRKICRSCRMKRCLEIGMLPENVQHKRNRRDSGTPPPKPSFDTFFNGFYPTFQTPGAPPPQISVPPTDPRHPPTD